MNKHGIVMNVKLPMKIVQKGRYFVASCPILDVYSQGETNEKAKENLKEALFLFLGSCIERGTLRQVLKDCGFEHIKPHSVPKHRHSRQKYINVPIELLSSKEINNNCHV
jgi:predicted RNase H-like HicB family nuclease